MSRHDASVRVRHMLDHAREAAEMAQGLTREHLDQDRKLNLALVRLMEIVGEAATRVPETFQQHHPQVPWRDVADFRNRLIHGYDTVDFDRLWNIIQRELPPLIAELERILGRENRTVQ